MTDPGVLQRQILSIGATVLDQAGRLDALSRSFTIVALIGMVAGGVLAAHANAACMALLALAALAGLVEFYFAIRVMIDAVLFRQLAMANADPDWATFDEAMLRLRMLLAAKAGRSPEDRIAGARRLMHRQAAALIVQAGLIIAGAIFAVAR